MFFRLSRRFSHFVKSVFFLKVIIAFLSAGTLPLAMFELASFLCYICYVLSQWVFLAFMQVTFSGLLNTLDGVASTEERIVFMTTNHLNRLDAALIRPGRVDLIQLIDLASFSQLRKMYARFYPDHQTHMADEFAEKVMNTGQRLSMAQIQGHFMLYKNDPTEAIKNVDKMASWYFLFTAINPYRAITSDFFCGFALIIFFCYSIVITFTTKLAI